VGYTQNYAESTKTVW